MNRSEERVKHPIIPNFIKLILIEMTDIKVVNYVEKLLVDYVEKHPIIICREIYLLFFNDFLKIFKDISKCSYSFFLIPN